MTVHRNNQDIDIVDRNGEVFPVKVSHTEENGHHTFVIAAEKENMERLSGLRGDISGKVKEEHGIKSNADISYAERYPDVQRLYQVNLDNLGPGPGKHGEPEHLKEQGHWVATEQIQSQLGNTTMPETPKQDTLDLKDARTPALSQDTLRQEQQRQHEQKIKM